jgi:flagellin FlaB
MNGKQLSASSKQGENTMFKQMHKNESGQTALETAIILIAFVVVASVFAFTILSAGSASTEKGEQAIYSGLEGVQSSMAIKGAVIAKGSTGAVDTVTFTVALASGGDPVNVDDSAAKVVTIGYRDATQFENNVDYTVVFITNVGTANDLLEDGELAEITVDISGNAAGGGAITLAKNTAFTLELKPPTGGILQINRTTPAAIEAVMDLN